MAQKYSRNYTLIGIGFALIIIITIPSIILLVKIIPKLKEKSANNNNNNDNRKDNKNDNEEIEETLVSSIKMLKSPNKMIYKEGEIFDKEGMIIQAIYTDKTELNITNYSIDKILPLTIYDRTITITYKKHSILLNIDIMNSLNIEVYPNPSQEKYTLEFTKNATRFETENANINQWTISNDSILEKYGASGGKYLKGIEENLVGMLVMYIKLEEKSDITMMVSYSPKEEWKYYDVDISEIYTLAINYSDYLEIDGENILNSREDTSQWQIIKYKSISLEKGIHLLSIHVSEKENVGRPNIDYIDFYNFKFEILPSNLDSDGKASNDFHTSLQYRYLRDENLENIFSYAKGTQDLSRPQGNLLNFSDSIEETEDSSNSYIIQISSSINFNAPDTKTIKNLKEKNYNIKNLKLGQIIFFRGAINEADLINSKIYIYKVNAIGPRNVDIPGVDNSRDIGGYKTSLVENGVINQGLYYRTAKLDKITAEGKRILTEDLGVKREIDLRDANKNKGPYVDGVEYYPIPIPSHTKTSRFEKFEKEYVNVFNLLSEADKNPIVLHCSAGADRTGIMSFAILTFLGCEYNDVARDYLFTNFGVQGKRDINSEFNVWWTKLDRYSGDTKAEKCKQWLMTKGIEEEKLEHIREIFIDGYKKRKKISNYESYERIQLGVKAPEIQAMENEELNSEIQFFK